jgi:hypothetical protein
MPLARRRQALKQQAPPVANEDVDGAKAGARRGRCAARHAADHFIVTIDRVDQG